jgi:hypothetical protein
VISLVSLEQIDHCWPVVMPWVEQACRKARSNRSAVQIYAQCRNGSLWLAVACTGPELADIVGVIVMDITDHEGERILQHVVVAGKGDTDTWLDEMVNWDWQDQMGVNRVISEGRPGWLDRMKSIVPSIRVVRQVYEWRRGDA